MLKVRCPDCRHADIQEIPFERVKIDSPNDVHFCETLLHCKICDEYFGAYNSAFFELLSSVEQLLGEPDSKPKQTVLKNCVKFLKGE